MSEERHPFRRAILYFVGLSIMAFGVVVSVRSDLGVTPISSIPYTMTVVSGMDLGIATIIFSVLMVALQIVVLRKDYKIISLLQLPVGIIFGLFLTEMGNVIEFIPYPEDFLAKVVLMLISTVFVAFGVFLYVSAELIPLAPEGFIIAVSKVTKKKFGTVKVISDVTMVVISLVTCLIMVQALGSVGIGTVVAAILVGNEVKVFVRYLGQYKNGFLGIQSEETGVR